MTVEENSRIIEAVNRVLSLRASYTQFKNVIIGSGENSRRNKIHTLNYAKSNVDKDINMNLYSISV